MYEGKLWIPYILLLLFGIGFLWWYPLQVYDAIWGFDVARGEFIGSNGQSQIFAFSIVAGILSLFLITYWIVNQEGRRIEYLPVALAVAYICTISVTMWYEQVFASLLDAANHSAYWFDYYTYPPKLLQVIMDMGSLLVAYPWMKRANTKLVSTCVVLTALFFVLWFWIGFEFPTSSPFAYFLNGASRITSQLAIAVTVKSRKLAHGH